jgi:hypothetical protein
VADAILAMAASYLPVSNFVVPASTIADRLLFFPSMWLVIASALVLDGAVRAHRTRAAAAVTATLAFGLVQSIGATTFAATWRDDVTLNAAAARIYPNIFRTQRNLAHALADVGDHEGAAWHLAIAEAIRGHYPAFVARDVVASAWEHEPLAAQLDHLSTRFGEAATCGTTRRAAARLRGWGDDLGSEELTRWTQGRGASCAGPP